eukprot:TRINITY_DN11164_c0_g1_i2.p1 TRINITY_DN11164_c0_g1~~TRINITY_DN11164_c0_g1_i2.p1  ORF type:complete len:760 (+),score=148.07 TRINITY_DN11164_c0_g1_i2:122-2281(+)
MVVEDLHESDNSCEIVNTATPGGTSNCLRRNRKEGTTAVLEALTQQISATRVELVSHCEDVVRLLGTAEQQLRRGGMQLEKCRDAAVATPPTASLLRPAPSFSPSHDGKNAARTEWRKLTWSSDVEREQGTYPASRALVTRQECPLRPDGFVAKPPSEKEGAVSTACSQKKHSRVMSACQSIEKFESPRDVKKSGTPQAWLPVPQRHSNTAPRIAPVEATDDGIQPNELSPELVESRSSLNLYTEQADRWLQRSKQVADLSRQLRDTDGQESSASEEESQPALFRDLQDMKDKVKQGLVQKKENQVDIYTESLCGRIAQAPWFENSALWVIAINSIWMAFEADYRDDASDGVLFILFLFMDNFFCVFFTLEIIVRFLSFKSKRSCVNFWFMFDFCMAVMMVFETWVLSLLVLLVKDFSLTGNGGGFGVMRLLRLLRLTRMARMMRLMRALPELLILIKGIAVATRSVFFTMCLLGFVVYIFAILFSTITDGTELHTARFKDIPTSILTLLLRGTLPDFADLAEEIIDQHFFFGFLYLCFVLLSSMTVMNMLVGILVEVVGAVSAVERQQLSVQFVKSRIMKLMKDTGLDADGDMMITKAEFESLLLNRKAAKLVQDIGVDVVGLVDYSDFLFKNNDALTFNEFMNLVFELRGCNTATVKDIVDLRRSVLSEMAMRMAGLTSQLKRISRSIDKTPQRMKSQRSVESLPSSYGMSVHEWEV